MLNSKIRVSAPQRAKAENKTPRNLGGSNYQIPDRIVGTGRIERIPSTNPLDNINNLLVSISNGEFWVNALAIILGIVLLIISLQGLIYAEINPIKKLQSVIPTRETEIPKLRKIRSSRKSK